MSIGKRLIDLARSELNSLLDRASRLTDDDDRDQRDDEDDAQAPRTRASAGKVRLEDLSDDELEAEIERRRLERELEERGRRSAAARAATGAYATAPGPEPPPGPRPRAGGSRPASTPSDPVARAYAALEVPPGSNFETVRKAYRSMMRKYHPDRHTATPEKQKAANELAQKLTESYKILEKRLRR